jgi:hypothetical protein
MLQFYFYYRYLVKKGNFQGILSNYLEPEPELELEPETEPKFGFAAPWSRSRKKYFGSATLPGKTLGK